MEAPAHGLMVLELVVFRLKEGVTREQLLGTVDAVSDWLADQPGFHSRDLLHDAEGDRWLDLVWWRSMQEAKAAAQRAATSAQCVPMFALIDADSTLMLHGEQAAN